MCFNFIMYYPNVDLGGCASTAVSGMHSFKQKYGRAGKRGKYVGLSFRLTKNLLG